MPRKPEPLVYVANGHSVELTRFTWLVDEQVDRVWDLWDDTAPYSNGSGRPDFVGEVWLTVSTAVPTPGSLPLWLAGFAALVVGASGQRRHTTLRQRLHILGGASDAMSGAASSEDRKGLERGRASNACGRVERMPTLRPRADLQLVQRAFATQVELRTEPRELAPELLERHACPFHRSECTELQPECRRLARGDRRRSL